MAQVQTVRGIATNVMCTNGRISVRYHNTLVVDVTPRKITLDTGGWKTVTTKLRMNQASCQFNLGYSVYQKGFAWFVEYQGNTYPFDHDEIQLNRETGAANYQLFKHTPVTCQDCNGVDGHNAHCYTQAIERP